MKTMDIPKYEYLNASTCQERYIIKHYPEFHKFLINKYPKYKWAEKLALYYNNLVEPPKCVVCGNPVLFYSFSRGWARTCSQKCAGLDPTVTEKKKKTNLKKFGVENAMKSPIIKEKLKKSNLKKFGVENPFQSEDIKRKIKHTNLERYGVETPMENINIRNKSKQTNLKRRGVEYSSQYRNGKTIYEKYPLLIRRLADGRWICKCPHKDCNMCIEKYFITQPNIIYDRIKLNVELCTRIHPINSLFSSYELEIRKLLDQYNIEYKTNVRDIIPPKELDLYIPSKQIAIEINGCYWHSEEQKSSNYHINKFKECQDHNIQLITIWEDWIINKPNIVKSIILNKLGLTQNKIYARQCIIKEVSSSDSTKFLNENHIQGRSNSTFKLGLYYNDELVSLMTFGKKRGCMTTKDDDEYELIRFCNKLNTSVVGGASKLLKYFIKKYDPKNIFSYSSNDISNGNLYKTLGFKSDYKISGSYWYVDHTTMQRYHRTSFTRSSISKKFGYDINDKSWTEGQIMHDLGYVKINDSGVLKWELEI